MRGKPDPRPSFFYAIDLEDHIRSDHPLRPIKAAVDEILIELRPVFDQAYAQTGRPGVPPEVLLKALFLQCLYSVRSERQLVERIDTDLLFRWFCGLDPAQDVFDATAFTHNRPRLDTHGITSAFFDAVMRRALNVVQRIIRCRVDEERMDTWREDDLLWRRGFGDDRTHAACASELSAGGWAEPMRLPLTIKLISSKTGSWA